MFAHGFTICSLNLPPPHAHPFLNSPPPQLSCKSLFILVTVKESFVLILKEKNKYKRCVVLSFILLLLLNLRSYNQRCRLAPPHPPPLTPSPSLPPYLVSPPPATPPPPTTPTPHSQQENAATFKPSLQLFIPLVR